MVVSGLPVRNGNKHAGEIATMALHLLSFTRDFKIQNLPNSRLQLRLGIHTGLLICFFIRVFTQYETSYISLFLRFRVAQLFQVILHNQLVLTKFRRCILADIDIRLTIDVSCTQYNRQWRGIRRALSEMFCHCRDTKISVGQRFSRVMAQIQIQIYVHSPHRQNGPVLTT